MSQVRLLHVVGNSGFGGAARIILRLALLAKAENWEVDILATDPVFQAAVRQHGIGLVDLDVIRRKISPVWDMAGVLRLYHFLRHRSYGIVHTHTSKAGFVGRMAARWAGVPVIVHTAHGFAFHEGSPAALRMAYARLERMASGWCDRIVSVSEFHRRWGLELGICEPEKMISIPNGIDAEALRVRTPRAELRHLWGARDGEPVILSTGRLAAEKGLEDLIEAAALLRRGGHGFLAVIAGDGPLRARLERLAAERAVADRVIFLGYREDIGDLLAACDQVVLPSLREGLSIAMLEAMAAGRPIVATRIGSNLELAAQAEMALLVAPGDPRALSEAVLRLMREPALGAALGRNARNLFQSRYTEDRMVRTYRKLYLDLLRARCPASPVVNAKAADLAGPLKV